jgi:hypothetical protein
MIICGSYPPNANVRIQVSRLSRDDNDNPQRRERRTQTHLRELRQDYDSKLRRASSTPKGERLGKRLEDSLSPAGYAASYPRNRYANHTRRKRRQFTKQGEPYARHRRDSIQGSTNAGLRPSVIPQFFATFAGKEEKKMTHSKQTT